MNILKRLLALALALSLLPLAALADAVRFSLRMDAAASPAAPPLAQGVAELMQAMTLDGTFAASGDGSFDLSAELLLDASERTRTSFRLYGVPSHMNLESSLLGDQTVLLYMAVLQEFAMKMYNHMGIPMQYVTIFYPYATQDTLRELESIWRPVLVAADGPRTVARDELAGMAQAMGERMNTSELPYYYIAALSADTGYDYMLLSAFDALADWFRMDLPEEGLRIVTDAEDREHWIAGDTTLAVLSDREGWLAVDDFGDSQCLRLDYAFDPASGSSRVVFDLTQNSESMLHVLVQADGLPSALPYDGRFTAALELTGAVVSTHETRIAVTGEGKGDTLTLHAALDGLLDDVTFVLHLTPIPDAPVPHYTPGDLNGVNVFTLADVSFGEFVRSVMGPLVKGALPLISHVPVSLCVACMDILTQGDVFAVLSGEGSFHDADRDPNADGLAEDDDWDFWDTGDEEEVFEEDDWDF